LQPQRTAWQNQVCLLCPLKSERPEIKPNCPMFHLIIASWHLPCLVSTAYFSNSYINTHTTIYIHKRYVTPTTWLNTPGDLNFQKHTLSFPPGDIHANTLMTVPADQCTQSSETRQHKYLYAMHKRFSYIPPFLVDWQCNSKSEWIACQ
jgi:hypothetical protein